MKSPLKTNLQVNAAPAWVSSYNVLDIHPNDVEVDTHITRRVKLKSCGIMSAAMDTVTECEVDTCLHWVQRSLPQSPRWILFFFFYYFWSTWQSTDGTCNCQNGWNWHPSSEFRHRNSVQNGSMGSKENSLRRVSLTLSLNCHTNIFCSLCYHSMIATQCPTTSSTPHLFFMPSLLFYFSKGLWYLF